jgi:uncharacterized cupredoxin-like copper-binding protein
MSITADKQEPSLEEEFNRLEANESALEQRTNSLTFTNVLGLVFGLLGFGIAMLALVIALANRDNNGPMSTRSAASAMPGGAMSGGGMMGGNGTGNAAPAAVRTIHVKLGEMWVKPDYTSVKAGKVTFAATNSGQLEHELMIERMPLKMDAPGRPNEEAAQGMIEDMEPGQSGKMTLKLTPGNYVLFCNVSGHYAAGQHIRFSVTS